MSLPPRGTRPPRISFGGFVREQVEEEATALEIVDRLRKAGEAGAFFVDAELGKR